MKFNKTTLFIILVYIHKKKIYIYTVYTLHLNIKFASSIANVYFIV